MNHDALLSVDLRAAYASGRSVLRRVSLEVRRGEVLGLVGRSGCGKSTLALAILRLLHLKGGHAEGRIDFKGLNLMRLRESDMRSLRGREIALVLQSPIAALNPALRLGTQMVEAWRVHRGDSTRDECAQAIRQSLERVSLPADTAFLRKYPAELSVGQAQRVLIAMAVLHRPLLLIADEPTSALDIITQAEVLDLFAHLCRDLQMSILFISHDLLSVATISSRVAVMEQGEIVECQPTPQLFTRPAHSYTRKLIGSLPVMPQFPAAVNF